MNKLPLTKRAQILSMLCEGSSMRSISRVVDVSINTVTKLLEDAGEACAAYHDEHVRGVKATRIQCDEVWAFCYSKQKNVATAKRQNLAYGDVWTWTAIEAQSKLVISYLSGGRDGDYALALMDDLRQRIVNRVQLTADGHKAYLQAVEDAFGDDLDYVVLVAMLVKLYGAAPEGQRRYSPADCVGAPDKAHISTSYVERANLTMRMSMRRFARLTNAYSKKLANHHHAQALYFMFYNFARQHKTLRMSPAMAVGISGRLWDMNDIVALIDAREAATTPMDLGELFVG